MNTYLSASRSTARTRRARPTPAPASNFDPAILDATAHSASFATVTRHAGDDADIVDFCIPCNPYFPTPEMFAELSAELPELLKYYPSDSSATTNKLAAVLGLNPQTVAMANGSTELITWIDHLLVRDSLAVPIPTFGRWTDQPLETGKRVDMFRLDEQDDFALDLDEYVGFLRERGSRVAVICNPSNPDGGYVPRARIVEFLDQTRDLDLVVIDESFIDSWTPKRAAPSPTKPRPDRTSSCSRASARTSGSMGSASAKSSRIPRLRRRSVVRCRNGTSMRWRKPSST